MTTPGSSSFAVGFSTTGTAISDGEAPARPVQGKRNLLDATRPRSRCLIPVLRRARHREKTGKVYLPGFQRMVSEHMEVGLQLQGGGKN